MLTFLLLLGQTSNLGRSGLPDQSVMDSIVHIISAIGIIVAALSSIWNHVKIRETVAKVEVASVKVEENTKAIQVVHDATNSMKDELVASVREEARAAGILQGHAEAQGGINTGSVK